MSETKETVETTETKNETTAAAKAEGCELNSVFAFKVGMTSYYDDQGRAQPATVLRYDPWIVSQVKTKERDGYEALQLACKPERASRATAATTKRLKAAGFENGAKFLREIRQTPPEGTAVGTKILLSSVKPGDTVKVTAISKGKGFAGVVKRWNAAGGPGSHGSGFHRRPGSVGNRTWPGRVMPGKKFPGHLGSETVTIKNLQIMDVIADENVIVVRGSVPGSVNTLVQLTKA